MSTTLAEFVKASPPVDAEDVTAAAAGDRNAFRRLVDRNRNLVSAVALSVVKDVAASEDISQEVFLHAWSGLRQLRSVDSFLPWLRQLARNKANDHLRARYRRDAVVQPAPPSMGLHEQPAPTPTHAEALEAREDRVRLAAAIEALPESTRETVLLYYREGQSIAQVALLLELSEEAVKKRLSRAREVLREALLEDVTDTIAQTTPSDRLTAAVLAALPPASSVKAVAWATAGKLAWTSFGAALVGPIIGLATMLTQHRGLIALARDDHERAALHRLRNTQLALTIGFTVAVLTVPLLGNLAPVAALGLGPLQLGAAVSVAFVALYVASTVFQYLPIRQRHWAARLAEEPSRAKENRRQLWIITGGLSLGATIVLGAMAWLAFGQ